MRSITCKAASMAILVMMLSACGHRVVVVRGGPTPAWVDRMPRKPGKLCAVGYSGPTFYQQDCIKNASENARGHLAESISVTIRTVTIDISDGTRGSFSKDVFVEGSESASEAVLQGSEVEAQWMDMNGQRGAPNGCYAYVCIDPDKPIEKMVEKLEEKKLPPKTVEKVRENAAAAFEELEKLEQQREMQKPEPPAPPAEDSSKPPAGDDAAGDELETGDENTGDEAESGADTGEQVEGSAEEQGDSGEQGNDASEEKEDDSEPGAQPAVRKIELPQD